MNQSGLGIDIGAKLYKPLDPRMSNLTGRYDEERFEENFSFLKEMRNREIGEVRKRIAAQKATGQRSRRLRRKLNVTSEDTLEDEEARLKVLTQQRADLERRTVDREAKHAVKYKVRQEVESGQHGAYFLKRKKQKRLEMEAKLEVLRRRGGEKAGEKVLARRRRKQKKKDSSLFAK